MAKPIPSPAQVAAINQELANDTTQRDAMLESASLQDSIITQKTLVDSAFQDLFGWYNLLVIGKYDLERKAINGSFVVSPVVEADLIAVAANPPTGRLTPTPPAQDIVRIAEFDSGAYTGLSADNEQQHITNQAGYENYLQNGVPGGAPTVSPTAVTASSLTSASTTLDVTDTAMLTLVSGDVLVVFSGGDAAVVKITSATPPVMPPPYDYTLGIQVIIPPAGTIGAGAGFSGGFSGFSDSERTAKIASDPNLQPLMNSLIANLELEINGRIGNLASEVSALSANDDPYAGSENTTASSNASASSSFLTSYLITTDISDSGLSSLSGERVARSSYLSSRVTEILNAYTMRTENFYEQRYQTANSRGNTSRGTLRAVSNAQGVKDTMLSMAAGLQGSIDALNGIL